MKGTRRSLIFGAAHERRELSMIMLLKLIRLAAALLRVPGGIDGPLEEVVDAHIRAGIFGPEERDEVVQVYLRERERTSSARVLP
jgi:hypothetical protein